MLCNRHLDGGIATTGAQKGYFTFVHSVVLSLTWLAREMHESELRTSSSGLWQRKCHTRLSQRGCCAAGELYRQLVDLFHFYQYFPIDDHTGQPVSDAEMVALQYGRLTQLQRLFFKYHPSLRELALANCGTLQKRTVLKPALQALEPAELTKLVVKQLRCVFVVCTSPDHRHPQSPL